MGTSHKGKEILFISAQQYSSTYTVHDCLSGGLAYFAAESRDEDLSEVARPTAFI